MRKRTKRLLAMLLAASMILQQGSTVGVLADETEPTTEMTTETTAAETQAESQEAETKAPETQAPETTASEIQAPETAAPETQAAQSETAAVTQTETAAQTEQSETTVQTETTAATETAETAAETVESSEQSETVAQEATEAPAQTEEATEVSTEAVTEKATDAATETEAPKTNFTYEDKRVMITAVAEAAANLPQDAEIHADYMQPGTPEYKEAAAALEAAYAGQDVVLDYVFYDIYFTAASAGDGRIEPEAGTVTVSMQFKKAELTPDEDVEVQAYDVVHVENGVAKEVPSTVQTTGDGSVASANFTSSEFSPYGLVTVGQEPATIDLDEPMPIGASVSLQDLASGDGGSFTVNAKGQSGGVKRNSRFDVSVAYTVASDKHDLAKNNTPWTYDLSVWLIDYPEFEGLTEVTNGSVMSGGNIVGKYTIHNNIVEIYPDETFLSDKTEGFAGTFEFSIELNEDELAEKDKTVLEFPGIATKEEIVYENVTFETNKNVNGNNGVVSFEESPDGKYTLSYSVSAKPSSVLTELVLEDTHSSGQELLADSIEVWVNDGTQWTVQASDYTYEGGKLTLDMVKVAEHNGGKIEAGHKYEVRYKTSITAAEFGKKQTNSAHWKWKGGTTEDKTTNVTPIKKLVHKEFVPQDDPDHPGQRIYEYTITFGDGKTNLAGHTISDVMTNNQKLMEGSFTVPDGLPIDCLLEYTDDYVFGNGNVTVFSYTFPETGSYYGPYIITYKTTTEGVTGNLGDVNINNTATDKDKEKHESSDSKGETHKYPAPSGDAQVDKEFQKWDASNKNVYWTIDVLIPDDAELPLTNVVIKEEEAKSGFGDLYNGNYTDDMVVQWNLVEVYQGETLLVEGKDYTINETDGTITFASLSANVSITMVTNAPGGFTSNETGKFFWAKNKASLTVNGKTVSDVDDEKYVDSQVGMEKYGAYDAMNKVFTWKVVINPSASPIESGVYAYFSDLLPEGHEFIGWEGDNTKIHVNGLGHQANLEYNVTVSISKDGNRYKIDNVLVSNKDGWEFDLHGDDKQGVGLVIQYQTKLSAEEERNLPENGIKEYKNVAAFNDKDGNALNSAEATAKRTKHSVTKYDMGINDNDIISYKVVVNEYAENLDPNSETLTLTDTISDLVEIVPNSIEIKDSDGNNVTDAHASYNSDTRVLTVVVPDSKRVVVTFSVQAQELGEQLFTNTVVLHGVVGGESSTEEKHKVLKHSATLAGAKNEIYLQKIDEDDMKKQLAGAKFSLYKEQYDNTTHALTTSVSVGDEGSYISDGSGQVKFSSLAGQTLYSWEETTAPDGYEKIIGKHYFILASIGLDAAGYEDLNQTKANREAALQLKKQIEEANPDVTVRVVRDLYSWPVSNKKDVKGKLTVTKVVTGNKTPRAAYYTVTVTATNTAADLSAVEVKGLAEGKTATKNGNTVTFEISTANTVELSNLPLGEYTVTEAEASSGTKYTATYKVDGSTASPAKVTFSNAVGGKLESAVEITNDYGNDTGKLTVTKVVTGNKTPKAAYYTVTVTASDEKADLTGVTVTGLAEGKTATKNGNTVTFEISTTGPVELSNLPLGEYTVTEAEASSGTKYTATYKVDGSTASPAKVTFSNAEGGKLESAVEITNDYGNDTGKLTVTKVVAGNKALKAAYYTVTVTASDEKADLTGVTVTGLAEGKTATKNGNTVTFEISTANTVELSNLPLGEYTVTEAEASSGTKYTATYKVDGSTASPAKVTFSNAEGGKLESAVEITNDYGNDTGKLTVTKVVAGNKAPTAAYYTVTVTATKTTADLSAVEVKGLAEGKTATKNGNTVTFEISTTDQVELSNLPLGEYTVTEAEASSGTEYTATYKVDGSTASPAKVTLSNAEGDKLESAIEITNDYGDDHGKLTVTKTVTGNKAPTAEYYTVTVTASDEKADLTGVTVTGLGTGKEATVKDNTITFEISTANTVELSNLPLGEYTVAETVSGTEYTATYKVDGSTASSAKVKFSNEANEKKSEAEVEITNAYGNDYGKLTVTKVVAGNKAPTAEYYTVTVTASDEKADLTGVTVTGLAEGKTATKNDNTVTFEISTTDQVELSNIPLGEYMVTEAEASSGTKYTATYKVDGSTASPAKVTFSNVEGGKLESAVEITNDYGSDTGKLTVTKVVAGNKAPAAGYYTITVTATNAAADLSAVEVKGLAEGKTARKNGNMVTFEISTTDKVELSNLPLGEYTVTESGSGTEYTATYKVDGSTASPAKVTFSNAEGGKLESAVEITNDYGSDTGKLTVTKVVAGNKAPTAGYYTVTVTATDAAADLSAVEVKGLAEGKTARKNGNTVTFEISTTDKVELSNLPLGEYTVTESGSGTEYTATYKVDGSTASPAKVKFSNSTDEKKSEANVEITNSYGNDYGKLTVTKVVAGNKAPAAAYYTVTVTATDAAEDLSVVEVKGLAKDKTATKNGNTVTFEISTTDKVELSNLPLGEYTVTEAGSGTEYTATYKVDGDTASPAKVTFSNAEGGKLESSVEITNDYGNVLGSLKVTKTFAGATLTDDQMNAVTFTVYGPATAADKGSQVARFTYSDMESGEYTVGNLAAGEYTVEETNETVPDYTVVTTYKVNGEDTQQKVQVELEKTAEMTVTNTYTKNTSIVLHAKKEFNQIFKAGDFSFTLQEVDSEGKPVGDPQTQGNKDGGEVTFDEIKYDAAGTYYYTISEVIPTGEDKDGTIVYDTTAYKVTVKVDLKDGALVATTDMATEDAPVVFTNKTTTVKVDKVDEAGNKLADANLQVTVKDAVTSEPVDSWKTDDKTHDITGKLEIGKTYVLEETDAPTGYAVADPIEFTIDADGDITVDGNKVENNLLTMTDAKLKFTVNKVETGNGAEVEGAKLSVYEVDENGNKSGTAVDTWISEKDKTHDFGEKLKAGKKYVLVEEVAPQGYAYTSDIPFSVGMDGTITAEGMKTTGEGGETVYLVEDGKLKLEFNKKALGTGEELDGAKLTLFEKQEDGTWKEVEDGSWMSKKGETRDFGDKLEAGKSYKLVEEVAPNGYSCVTDMEFTVEKDGTITGLTLKTEDKDGNTVYVVEDTLNKISILKVDEAGAALAGAKLIVKDATGKVVDGPWTTDGKAHDITGLAKGTYTLSEVEAPEGYELAQDMTFTITGTEKVGDTISVTMTDKKAPADNKNALTVTKKLRVEGITSDYGLRDATFYVALFSDAARTQRVSSVKAIVFKDASTSSVTFNNLAAGTYYVGETDANGTSLPSGLLGTTVFTPEYTSSSQFAFEGKAETGNAELTNVFLEVPDGLYLSGEITVTKKILVNGEEGTSNDTFYARVFSDAGLTQPVSDVLVLDLAGGSSVSATATNLFIGVTLDSSARYYVAETDANGTPLDPDAITEFEISIDKSEVVLSPNASSQEVVITNSFTEEEETEEETETETEAESETEVSKKTAAPQTGDDTNYMLYLLLMALSAGICAVAFEEKRRRSRTGK